MFLKIATVLAILGVGLSLLLALIQQFMFWGKFYSDGFMLLSRFISVADLFLLNGSLVIFLVAFLLSLKGK